MMPQCLGSTLSVEENCWTKILVLLECGYAWEFAGSGSGMLYKLGYVCAVKRWGM